METRYALEVRLSIRKEERTGPDDTYWRRSQEQLTVEETVDLGWLDFQGLTGVLAALHQAVHDIHAPAETAASVAVAAWPAPEPARPSKAGHGDAQRYCALTGAQVPAPCSC